jgi:hypothetical protein
MDVLSLALSGIAVAISVLVFMDTRRRQTNAERLARKPVLVYRWDPTKGMWQATNIGNGPALDVVAVQRFDGRWAHPLRIPKMAAQDVATVPNRWYGAFHPDPGLGVRYRSVTGEKYMTRTGDDWSQVSDGWGDMPAELWDEIEPHWRYT